MTSDDRRLRFAAELIELRAVHHLTQQELGNRIGISPQYVCDLESGRRAPSIRVCDMISDKFGPIRSDSYTRRWHRLGAMAHGWLV